MEIITDTRKHDTVHPMLEKFWNAGAAFSLGAFWSCVLQSLSNSTILVAWDRKDSTIFSSSCTPKMGWFGSCFVFPISNADLQGFQPSVWDESYCCFHWIFGLMFIISFIIYNLFLDSGPSTRSLGLEYLWVSNKARRPCHCLRASLITKFARAFTTLQHWPLGEHVILHSFQCDW